MPRRISEIAVDITKHWPEPYYGARPYLGAMLSLSDLSDHYGADDAEDIVLRFLCNASKWRGPEAKRIKSELNTMLKEHKR